MLLRYEGEALASGYADTVPNAITGRGAAKAPSTLTTHAGPTRGIVALREPFARPAAKERDSDIEALPPSIRERYEDLWLLGEGGMGTVYRGRDRRLGRTVALKLLRRADPDHARRLLQEARAQARVQHEQVCRVYEAGEADGEPFITMQYIEGEPLDKAKTRMTLEQKVKIILEVAVALHEAHRLGLVHRDIKPGNILVETGQDGAIKPYIVDFGLARDISEHGQTMTGAVLGTPAFMAPEQARGEVHSLDRRTDVYSLGATLYDLLAGRPPFVAEHPWKVLAMVADEEVPPVQSVVKELPLDLSTIVMKCLQREPSQRYESARALSEDLQRFLDGEPIQARRAALGYVLWRKAKKHRLALLLSGAAVLSAVVPAGAWVHARQQAAEQVVMARELGEDVKEMELFLHGAYTLPLHDVEKERDIVRARLGEIEQRMDSAGRLGQGPGHYALGRGHLALGEPQKAREHLEQALSAGYSSVELRYALGRAFGELYKSALEETKRIQNKEAREAKVRQIEATLRDPALAHLGAAAGAAIESPAYAQGLIAFYGGKHEEALVKAKEAFEKSSWLYEAKKLEGDVQYALGSRYRHDAEFDWDKMMAHFGPAAEAYRAAADMARSDPEAHRAECELWTQIMNATAYRGELMQSSFDKAEQACTKAVAASSKDGRARLQRAFAHSMFLGPLIWDPPSGHDPRKPLEQAAHLAEEAVAAFPQDAMAHYIVGTVASSELMYMLFRGYDTAASLRRARSAFEAALRIDPEFLWALQDLSSVYAWQMRIQTQRGLEVTATMERAMQLIEQAFKLNPGMPFLLPKKAGLHGQMVQHLLERGQSPQEHVERVVAIAEEMKRRSPGSLDPYGLIAGMRSLMAVYESNAGQDPRPSLEQAEQNFLEIKRRGGEGAIEDCIEGDLRYAQILHLLRRGGNLQPALRDAREAFRRGSDVAPWDMDWPVRRARVEIIAIRSAIKQHSAHSTMFDAAFAPLQPFFSEERLNPDFYQTLAEIHALRAAWYSRAATIPRRTSPRASPWPARPSRSTRAWRRHSLRRHTCIWRRPVPHKTVRPAPARQGAPTKPSRRHFGITRCSSGSMRRH